MDKISQSFINTPTRFISSVQDIIKCWNNHKNNSVFPHKFLPVSAGVPTLPGISFIHHALLPSHSLWQLWQASLLFSHWATTVIISPNAQRMLRWWRLCCSTSHLCTYLKFSSLYQSFSFSKFFTRHLNSPPSSLGYYLPFILDQK